MQAQENKKYCSTCQKVTEFSHVAKPDVELKLCKECGHVVSILYKDS